MILWVVIPPLWMLTQISGSLANQLGRYDDDYLENGYLRSGKRYSPNIHSYPAGDGHNERYADGDRYMARNLQKAPDYRRDDDDDRDGRSGAYNYGGDNWRGQHYPVKSTHSYIKPTPASSTTCPTCTTPSCVTVSTTTTISRLVSICQLHTTYAYVGTTIGLENNAEDADDESSEQTDDPTVSLVSSETGTCTLVALPSKLVPDCCSGPSTASSSEPCFTSTFVRTILRDKTCTITIETGLFRDVAIDAFDGQPTSATGSSFVTVYQATTCAL